MSAATWGLIGVLVGSILGFLSTIVAAIFVKRWEVRFSACVEAYRTHLPQARLIAFRRDSDSLVPIDRLVRDCTLVGHTERALALVMAGKAGEWDYFDDQARDVRLEPDVRDQYEKEAVRVRHEFDIAADELQDRLEAAASRPLGIRRRGWRSSSAEARGWAQARRQA